MSESSVKKVNARTSPHGDGGQKYLVAGKHISMRLWEDEQPDHAKVETSREYETVGFVLSGRAELHLEGQMLILEPGDSWLVPAGARHRYRILEAFTAVEATSPVAHVHARDEQPG